MVVSNLVNEIVPTGGTGLADNAENAAVTTTDGSATDMLSIAIAEGEMLRVEAWILAYKGTDKRGSWHMGATFYRNPGVNITRENYDTNLDGQLASTAEWTVELAANTSTQKAVVRVTGKAGETVRWEAKVNYSRLTG